MSGIQSSQARKQSIDCKKNKSLHLKLFSGAVEQHLLREDLKRFASNMTRAIMQAPSLFMGIVVAYPTWGVLANSLQIHG